MFCLASQPSQLFATALIVIAVVIEPQNKQYSSWGKRVGKQGRGPLLQSCYNWYTNRWQNSNWMFYYIPNVFLLFLFLSFKFIQTNSKSCNMSSYSPAVTSCPYLTTNLVQCFLQKSQRAHSSGASVYHSFSWHIWGHLTAPEQCPVLLHTTSHHQIDLGN